MEEQRQEEEEEEEVPQLLRTKSDASFVGVLRRRCKSHSAKDMQRLRTHRYSINGHFYNHKVTHTLSARTERTPALVGLSGC